MVPCRADGTPKAKPPHAGISMFIVAHGKRPGITIQPATTMVRWLLLPTSFYDNVAHPSEKSHW